jgi:hypothetical protein
MESAFPFEGIDDLPNSVGDTLLGGGPHVGRIVTYRLRQQDVGRILEQRKEFGIGGNSVKAGDEFPMIIVRVWSRAPKPDDAVNGQVFLDGHDTLWVTSVHAGPDDGDFSF